MATPKRSLLTATSGSAELRQGVSNSLREAKVVSPMLAALPPVSGGLLRLGLSIIANAKSAAAIVMAMVRSVRLVLSTSPPMLCRSKVNHLLLDWYAGDANASAFRLNFTRLDSVISTIQGTP